MTTAARVELVRGDGGAQHVDPVQGGFGVDLVLLAGDRQGGVGDGDCDTRSHVVSGLVEEVWLMPET